MDAEPGRRMGSADRQEPTLVEVLVPEDLLPKRAQAVSKCWFRKIGKKYFLCRFITSRYLSIRLARKPLHQVSDPINQANYSFKQKIILQNFIAPTFSHGLGQTRTTSFGNLEPASRVKVKIVTGMRSTHLADYNPLNRSRDQLQAAVVGVGGAGFQVEPVLCIAARPFAAHRDGDRPFAHAPFRMGHPRRHDIHMAGGGVVLGQ